MLKNYLIKPGVVMLFLLFGVSLVHANNGVSFEVLQERSRNVVVKGSKNFLDIIGDEVTINPKGRLWLSGNENETGFIEILCQNISSKPAILTLNSNSSPWMSLSTEGGCGSWVNGLMTCTVGNKENSVFCKISERTNANTQKIENNVVFFEKEIPSAEEMASIISSNNSTDTLTRSLSVLKHNTIVNNSIGLPIKFDIDSYDLNSSSEGYLKNIAKMMVLENMKDVTVMLEGHTDSLGDKSYNLMLSEKRALEVKKHLVDHYKIDPSRIKVSGKGELDTLPNRSASDPANRRVQIFGVY